MSGDAEQQLKSVRKELEAKREELHQVGRLLKELGYLLQYDEPEKWLLSGQAPPSAAVGFATKRLRPDLEQACDCQRLRTLLEEMRELRQREIELRKTQVGSG
jgi:hypothetical protein